MATANKIALVNNRVEIAKNYLLYQFKDKPNINALVDALVSELQELENVINDLQTVRTLDGSYGWWTDQIGSELDISRGNYADNDYKTAIKIAMAKQSASASVEDILRIVSLITSDTDATIANSYPYMMELYSWLFCVSDSYDGLSSLAQLFPLNTRIRMLKHNERPILFNVTGQGIDPNTTLCDLVYYRNGHADDPRFVTTPTQDIPPALTSAPTIVSNPYIYGEALVNSTLTLVVGVYDGDDPLTYSIQWLRDGADISAATANTYLLVAGDAGKSISARVTVSNSYGGVVAYSNNIPVSSTIPPTSPFTDDLGLRTLVASVFSTGTPITSTAAITISKDGNMTYDDNGTVVDTLPWSSSPTTDVGADYSFFYSVVRGSELAGLNQNNTIVLSANKELSLSVTNTYNAVKTGTYDFTIFKTSDNSISMTKRIVISATIEG